MLSERDRRIIAGLEASLAAPEHRRKCRRRAVRRAVATVVTSTIALVCTVLLAIGLLSTAVGAVLVFCVTAAAGWQFRSQAVASAWLARLSRRTRRAR